VSLAFLHTARPNVETFRRLVEAFDPSLAVTHALLESVLAGAVETGSVTDAMRLETENAIRTLADDGATIVVCTCSTIGGVAESTMIPGVRVMRIDRPMAEQAVASGRRIVVAATLPSTLQPTMSLIRQVAEKMGREVDIAEWLCSGAWPHFERGDRDAYAQAVAESVTRAATPEDIVVLAQASMAPAAQLIRQRGIAALASPELGVRVAIERLHRTSADEPQG
jgi:hypothetical protein